MTETRLRRGSTLTAMVAAAGIVQLPTSAIVVALPTLHSEFDTSTAALQWTVTAFFVPFTALLVASGRLADIFGRRRAFVAGAALFIAGSVLAAVAGDMALLIGGIAVAGTGSALMMPASLGILTNVFTGSRRGVAIGLWGAATEVVSGVGVLVGGVLTGALSWRWIFWVDVVVTAVVLLLVWRGTPESSDPTAPRNIDVGGVVLSAASLTTLTLALTLGPNWGWSSARTIGLFAATAVTLVAFVVVELHSSHPIISFGFFRRRNFAGSTIVLFVIDFSFGALLFFLPTYTQEALGYSAMKTGLLLLPMTALMAIGSPAAGRIAAKTGPRPPIVAGLTVMATGIFLVSNLSLHTGNAQLWATTAIAGLGLGLALTPMNLAAMNAVSRTHAAAATGILVTLSGLGATLGVALPGAVFQDLQVDRTVRYAEQAGVAVTTEQAQQLDGLLAGSPTATATLNQVAGAKAPAVENAVREAFVSALNTSLRLCGVVVLLGLGLAIALMRKQPPVDDEPHDLPVPPPPTRAAARPHRSRPVAATSPS